MSEYTCLYLHVIIWVVFKDAYQDAAHTAEGCVYGIVKTLAPVATTNVSAGDGGLRRRA